MSYFVMLLLLLLSISSCIKCTIFICNDNNITNDVHHAHTFMCIFVFSLHLCFCLSRSTYIFSFMCHFFPSTVICNCNIHFVHIFLKWGKQKQNNTGCTKYTLIERYFVCNVCVFCFVCVTLIYIRIYITIY